MTRRKKNKSRNQSESEFNVVTEIEDISQTKIRLLTEKQIRYLIQNPEVFTWNFDDNDRVANIFHILAKTGRHDILSDLLKLNPPFISINQPDLESKSTPLHDAIYYGNIYCAVKLIQAGASLDATDHDGFAPLDIAVWSQFKNGFVPSKAKFNITTWGANVNYNLGHSHDGAVKMPEKIKAFNRDKFKHSICNVNFGKYHTLFLDTAGDVYCSGYGPGGRLGLGNEDTQLTPVKIPYLKNIVKISCSNDQSLALSKEGHVYSWGINTHKVLGHTDNSKPFNRPRMILFASNCSRIITVKAAKYHSILVAKDQIYTFGFNGGQIGHMYSENLYQVVPRSVTRLRHVPGVEKSNIAHVHSSAAVTVIGFENGVICICSQYEVRKVATLNVSGSTSFHIDQVVTTHKIRVTGGKMSREVRENSISRPTKDILIVVLDSNGLVYACSPNKFKNALVYSWNVYSHKFIVSDISLGSGCMMLLTTDGEVYTCNPYPQLKSDKEIRRDHSLKTWSSIGQKKKESPQMLKPMKLLKQQGLHSGVKVVCNSTGLVKACIVEDRISVNDIKPKLEPSTFTADIASLYDNDDVYDTDFRVYNEAGRCYNVHKAVIANSSRKLFNLVVDAHHSNLSSINISSTKLNDGFAERVLETAYFKAVLPDFKTPPKTNFKPLLFDDYVDPNCCTKIDRLQLREFSDVTLISNDGSKFECHRCILAARNEYFMTHFMMNSRWGNPQLNKEILIDTTKQTLSELIYYIYTDNFPRFTTMENLKNLLSISDLYFCSKLKSFCEMEITNLITEENLISVLVFANDYNASQLREVCLNIIAMNMPYYLEYRTLERLESNILELLDNVYKEVVLFHMSFDKPTVELASLEEFLQSFGTIEHIMTSPRNTKPRSSSHTKVDTQVISEISETIPVDLTEPFPQDLNSHLPAEKVSKKKDIANTTPRVWGSDVVSNGASSHETYLSLTEIMKQEEKQKHLNGQCSRKNIPKQEKPPKIKTGCPWASPSTESNTILDFKSIMSEAETKSITQKSNLSPPQSTSSPKRNTVISPVRKSEIFDFNPNRKVHSLKDIMDAEAETKSQTFQHSSFNRSLSVIQIEEQAIQELSEFYKVDDATEETIAISTVPKKIVSKPSWGNCKSVW